MAAVAATTVATNDAQACGGCFHPEDQTQQASTVVTGHRMALSISTAQTVLWDQVAYAGNPADFAWVLPVKQGARIEVSNDAWFESLEAATTAQVQSPALFCGGNGFFGGGGDYDGGGCDGPSFGCSASDEAAYGGTPTNAQGAGGSGEPPPPPVDVVHQGTIGPYDTVTLHANEPGALTGWLVQNGYAIDPDIQPIIDAYTAEGFDFIALRLAPTQGIQQMKPVRVVSPGAVPTLPLRMVAAGTGANVAITLFVLGEGRWATGNFPGATIDDADLAWDFATSSSNYGSVRDAALAAEGGRTWLTAYAKKGALLSPIPNPVTGSPTPYNVGGGASPATTIADAYVRQGVLNGEASSYECMYAADAIADASGVVVDPCPPTQKVCDELAADEIDNRTLACGTLDDLAVALVGMHPRDVWLTRLESALPRAALADDLGMAAATDQAEVESFRVATQAQNEPCPLASAPASGAAAFVAGSGPKPPRPTGRRERRDQAMAAISLLALGLLLERRTARGQVRTVARATARRDRARARARFALT